MSAKKVLCPHRPSQQSHSAGADKGALSVHSVLRLSCKGRPPALSDEQVSAIRFLLAAGYSTRSIAALFQVGQSTVVRAGK
jgi:predicted RNA polymerase sigma factor